MTPTALDEEPACPGAGRAPAARRQAADDRHLVALRCSFDAVARPAWEALARATAWATPFSSWAFQRAWWDAYGANAHDETLVVLRTPEPGAAPVEDTPVAIVPLMHRHVVEPGDEDLRTRMRHGDDPELIRVEPTAKAIFMGASYHADYATILAAEPDLPGVARAVAGYLAGESGGPLGAGGIPWDAVDLRRFRCGDPAADELEAAFGAREMAAGWTLNVEREDVCPVATLPGPGATLDDYLGTLAKTERHEVRRKLRRAEALGEVRLVDSADPLADLDAFVELHQRRWGEEGLFRPGRGGEQSRRFVRRLFELFGPDAGLHLSFLVVGERRVAAGIWFDDARTIYYYNAGVEPAARELSPGVLLVARLAERALRLGRRRLDFLRGNEPYKYEWGAVDEPLQRILVRRSAGA